jgi:magnesium chelatase family protein
LGLSLPCGYFGDPVASAVAASPWSAATRHGFLRFAQDKLWAAPGAECAAPASGIDVHIEAPRVEYEKLSDDRLGEPSAAIREWVEAARDSQRSQRVRFEGTRLRTNADTPALLSRMEGKARVVDSELEV